MAAHGHTNGNQLKSLAREIRRAERLADRLDRALSLAGQESGKREPVVGARQMPSIVSTAPLQSVPAPTPEFAPPSPQAYRGDLESTFGVSGTPITSGFLTDAGEYNPELMGRNAIHIYEQMRRGDAQVRATLAACKLPVQSAKWEVIPNRGRRGIASGSKAKEVAEFVAENFFGGLEFRTSAGGWTSQSWDDVVRNALLMLDFGCAVYEEVWRIDGEKIRLRSLPGRLPLTFYRWHTEADGETLLGLEQYGYRRGQFVNATLPADKMAIFVYNREGANFWGMALLRAMYPHWYVKTQLYRIDAIACERNALGVPVWKLPPGFSEEDREAAYNFVTQLAAHEATGAVEPPGEPHTGLRIVGYQGNLRDVMPSIQHHNVMIARAALALFMDLGTAQHGSRALGQEHGDFFMLALQNLADQIAHTITNTTIRRLVEFNYGEDAPVPRLVAANVQSRGLSALVEALTRFAQAGLLVSEQNLRRFIREELALPEESTNGIISGPGNTIDDAGGEDTEAGVQSPDLADAPVA
jgi:hypothetical protein